MLIAINTIAIGKIAPLGAQAVSSGIMKKPVPGPWTVTTQGISGDAQGDTLRHGGLEKAIHHYPYEHYEAWRRDNPSLGITLSQPSSFGENFSTLGITEDEICVGDVFQVGTAVIQVSQGRQPCWKLNLRFDCDDMAYRVQTTGRTGWYYRVKAPGQIAPGDLLKLVQRPHPLWSIARLISVLYQRTGQSEELAEMVKIDELSKSWRDLAARRLSSGTVENWSSRLVG